MIKFLKLTSTKVQLVWFTELASFVLLLLGKIQSAEWVQVSTMILGLFYLANVAQKKVLNDGRETD